MSGGCRGVARPPAASFHVWGDASAGMSYFGGYLPFARRSLSALITRVATAPGRPSITNVPITQTGGSACGTIQIATTTAVTVKAATSRAAWSIHLVRTESMLRSCSLCGDNARSPFGRFRTIRFLGESKVCPTSTVSCNYRAMARVFSSLAMRYVRAARKSAVRLPRCGGNPGRTSGFRDVHPWRHKQGMVASMMRPRRGRVALPSRHGRDPVVSPSHHRENFVSASTCQHVNMSTFVRHRRAVQ